MTSERRDDEKRDRRVEVQTCGPDSILANHERAQGPVNKTKARARLRHAPLCMQCTLYISGTVLF